MERWVAVFLVVALLLPLGLAHKFPIIEYTYVGHIWEEAYTTIPRQTVIDEPITILAGVQHPGNEIIAGEVTALISVYQDDTTYHWYGGKSYKQPDWQLLKEAQGTPTGKPHEFSTQIVIDRPGSYQVFIDWYEDGQYIGQSMHMLDVEQRTVGPLFLGFSALIIIATLIGVKRGIL